MNTLQRFFLVLKLVSVTMIFSQSSTDEYLDNLFLEDEETIHILSYKQIVSKKYTGWKIAYTELNNNSDFIIPLEFSFSNYRFYQSVLDQKNLKIYDRYNYSLGINGYIEFFNGVFVGLGVNTPIGYERYQRKTADKKSSRFLIGIETKQALLIVPWKDLGVNFNINFNQGFNFTNSVLFNREINLELGVGINF